MFTSLLEVFTLIHDNRRKQGTRYDLPHFLLYCILAIMAGAKSYEGIRRVLYYKLDLLNKTFGTKWKKPPSVGGIYDILSKLDIKSLEEAFRAWSLTKAEDKLEKDSLGNPKLVMAIDGKALRGTRNLVDKNIKNLVSVFESNLNLVLAHAQTTNKDSEIEAVKELIEDLQIPYTMITMDAMHTQKNFK